MSCVSLICIIAEYIGLFFLNFNFALRNTKELETG